jgi:hypothetical protein
MSQANLFARIRSLFRGAIMAKPEKTNESSTSTSTSSSSIIRDGIKQMTQRGVEFEVSPDGSVRVSPSSYPKYLKLNRDSK